MFQSIKCAKKQRNCRLQEVEFYRKQVLCSLDKDKRVAWPLIGWILNGGSGESARNWRAVWIVFCQAVSVARTGFDWNLQATELIRVF